MIRQRKKMGNKGFTLVELIVVLVILTILAAILVPALLGYIDRSKEQQIVLEGKSCLTAAQAELSSMYAKGKTPSSMTSTEKNRILDTADVASSCKSLIIATKSDGTGRTAYTVAYVSYTDTNDNTIVFDGSSWDSDNTKPTGIGSNIVIKAEK